MDASEVAATLQGVIKDTNSKVGRGVAKSGKDIVGADVKYWVPTESILLNLLLGEDDFGCPSGKIMEIFGDSSEGKSTILQILMNAFQAAGGISVLVDSESAWNRKRAIAMGHNEALHTYVDAEYLELAFETINTLIDRFTVRFGDAIPILIGYDTIAAHATESEKGGDQYAEGMMSKPKKIRAFLRQCCLELPKIKGQLVLLNQTIESPKDDKSGIKKTSGGGGPRFWSSHRLEVRRVGVYKWAKDARLEGILSNVKTIKNRMHPPHRSVTLPINFLKGCDPIREVYTYLHDHTNLVNTSGAYKRIVGFQEKDISCYEKDFPAKVREHEGLLEWMQEQVRSHWLTGATF